MRFPLFLAMLCAVLSLHASGGMAAAAAGSVSIVPKGGTTYEVQGIGLSGVGGFEAIVSYDPATLSSPQVTQGNLASGSGLIFMANPKYAAGQVKMVFIIFPGTISGTGQIASITFVPLGKTWSTPTIAANLTDTNGVSITGGSNIPLTGGGGWTPGTPADIGTDRGTDKTLGSTGDSAKPSATGIANWPGTISLGGEPKATSEPPRQTAAEPPPPVPVSETPRTTPPPDTTPAKPREKLVLPAPPAHVLERFRTYKGERTVTALKPLFTHRGGSWIVQDPAIARADGTSPLTVLITLERMGLEAPNFALRGVELKTLKTVGETGWAIEGVPAANAVQATISMLLDDAATDIPLVVVPPLKGQWAGKKLTEADVNRFLAERGTDKAPLGDLNNDGRRDYRDDYIMVGNYLLATAPVKEKASSAPAEQKPAAAPVKP